MKVWVNLNTYNEVDNIQPMTEAILSQPMENLFLAVVDDNSSDGTGQIADRLQTKYSNLQVLHRPRKEGIGPAYRVGFSLGLDRGYDYFLQIDADFSHDPNDLPRLVAELDNADMVIGSRYVTGGRVEGVEKYRQWISRWGNWYIEKKLHLPIADVTAGFVGYRREALEKLEIQSIGARGYAWQIETKTRAFRHGLRLKEIPIVFRERRANQSKFHWEIAWECLKIVKALKLR